MCYKLPSRKGAVSPVTVNLVKITVVLVFFCFAECAAGSCLNYGHACWGAHGKRSGNQNPLGREETSGKDFKTKWFLSRLIQGPLDLHYPHERDMDIAAKRNSESLFSGNDGDSLRGQDWESIQDLIADDQLFDDSIGRSMENSRLRSPKVLDKRSIKHD
ncbi:uncharacterized protein LOC108904389 [Anoplophora glabripennis]|uniref:uncharacterized protein LOC108904389 n=1 Tax=Anoplophora glabripennis TaxID=217634 RepID=UPI0008747920|nr:uncharacterized protein LOC108904389 [Anoplophora glabripennis]